MVQKRPLIEDSYVVSSKHPKFEDGGNLVSSLEFPSTDVGWKPFTSGKGYDGSIHCLVEIDKDTETCDVNNVQKESAENSSGENSNYSRGSSCISEEDFPHASSDMLVSPEKDDPDYPLRTLVHSRDTYRYLLERPPQKLVSIGIEFQAELPEWCPHCPSDTSPGSYSAPTLIHSPHSSRVNFGNHLNVDKFLGTCLIPMPDMESSACHDDGIVCGCVCPGSVTCVRQHIDEAREDLTRMVGQETFAGLGFHDMGEVVAEKWSEEDEQVFEEVVLSNPSSVGKSFWDCLSAVFPSRTKKEIISYYYNAFMLRRRAKQNRCNSMDIDSDNDEWQESDDGFANSDDGAISEEDEDSVEESPLGRDVPLWSRIYDDSHEYGYGVVKDESCQYNAELGINLEGISTVSKTYPLSYYGADDMFSPYQENLWDVWGNNDSNDHLRTSSVTGAEVQASLSKTDNAESASATFDGVNVKGGHEYFFEPCDAKGWDFEYSSCPGCDVEFLPTSYMMEEVFGVGDSDNNAGDDKLV